MSRILALLAAIGLVVGAVVARGYVTGERELPDGPLGPGATTEPLVLACPRLLADACGAADLGAEVTVRIEQAGTTAASWAEGPEAGPDAWLVPQPWPAAADALAGRRGEDAAPVALGYGSSPLVLAVWEDRADALLGACGGRLTWSCVGEQSGRPWAELGAEGIRGNVRPAHADPRQDALAGVVLVQAAASFLGNADPGSQQLRTPEFTRWFGGLEDGVPRLAVESTDLLTDLRTQEQALADVVGLPEALVPPDSDLRVPEPAEPASAQVVLAVAPRRRETLAAIDERLRPGLTAALAEAGWEAPASDPEADDGLPSGGFLVALQQVFGETR